jgi:hypothetical protein
MRKMSRKKKTNTRDIPPDPFGTLFGIVERSLSRDAPRSANALCGASRLTGSEAMPSLHRVRGFFFKNGNCSGA